MGMGKNLKFYRDKSGLTQEEVAEIVEVSKDYISMLERYIRKPGRELAKKLADLYGTTVDALLYATIEPNKTFSK